MRRALALSDFGVALGERIMPYGLSLRASDLAIVREMLREKSA